MAWSRDATAARRTRVAGRLLREPRHRLAAPGGQPRAQGMEVWLQSENGLLRIGPFPAEDEVDANLINCRSSSKVETRHVVNHGLSKIWFIHFGRSGSLNIAFFPRKFIELG